MNTTTKAERAAALKALNAREAKRMAKEHKADKARAEAEIARLAQHEPEVLAGLRMYAEAHGAQWRHKLRCLWLSGADARVDFQTPHGWTNMRRVRNTLGPVGIEFFSAEVL